MEWQCARCPCRKSSGRTALLSTHFGQKQVTFLYFYANLKGIFDIHWIPLCCPFSGLERCCQLCVRIAASPLSREWNLQIIIKGSFLYIFSRFRKDPNLRWRNGKDRLDEMRFPEVMADAAYAIMTRNSRSYTGCVVFDENVLRDEGITNFDAYGVKTGIIVSPFKKN